MMPLVGRSDVAVVFSGMNGQPEMYDQQKKYMASWAHPGSQRHRRLRKALRGQALKVMAQAVPQLRKKAVMITDYSADRKRLDQTVRARAERRDRHPLGGAPAVRD